MIKVLLHEAKTYSYMNLKNFIKLVSFNEKLIYNYKNDRPKAFSEMDSTADRLVLVAAAVQYGN